jgi:hypothetical protein
VPEPASGLRNAPAGDPHPREVWDVTQLAAAPIIAMVHVEVSPRLSELDGDGGLAGPVKTRYLYSMSSRLINVRLDEERLRKARALREKGILLSDLVRTAIDERYGHLVSSRKPRDVRAILERIDAAYPISEKDLPRRKYDVHDRKQAAAAIRRRLVQKRKRKPRGA